MKNIKYTLSIFLFLIFSSCSKDDLDVVPNNELSSADETSLKNAEVGITEAVTATTPLPFMTKYDLSIKNGSATNGLKASATNSLKASATHLATAAWTQYGPYTVPSTLALYLTRQKLYIPATPNNAAGVYICDVYRAYTNVTLQAGDIMLYESSSKVGYLNYSTREEGVGITQDAANNSYYFFTYSVVPRYDSIGRAVNIGVFPRDLTGTTFTYSYLRP